MLVTFKSKAAAEVLMYEEHAKRILDLLGKDVAQGIITAAETAQAIATLEAEIAESRARQAAQEQEQNKNAHPDDDVEEDDAPPVPVVSFSTRAYPLLEMLRAAHSQGRDVVWGV